MFTRIIIGLLIIGGGIICLKYAVKIWEFFGDFNSIERILGSGGTVNFWKILGIIMMILGILYIFNMLPAFMSHQVI